MPRARFPALARPKFLAIVSSNTLASTMLKRANGRVDGFVIETATAGGHNAPPRGKLQLSAIGEPLYGERDRVSIEGLRSLGVPILARRRLRQPIEAPRSPRPGSNRHPGRHRLRIRPGVRPARRLQAGSSCAGALRNRPRIHRSASLAHRLSLQNSAASRHILGIRNLRSATPCLQPGLPARGVPLARGPHRLPLCRRAR